MLALLSSRFICLGFKSPSIKLIANVFTLILITAVISVLTAFGLDNPQNFHLFLLKYDNANYLPNASHKQRSKLDGF
jgi:hypothetical protein